MATSDPGHVAECDVVVVGGGGAGMAAAIEAANLGRSVVLLEKNPASRPRDMRAVRIALESLLARARAVDEWPLDPTIPPHGDGAPDATEVEALLLRYLSGA